jgi:hypothetical protein
MLSASHSAILGALDAAVMLAACARIASPAPLPHLLGPQAHEVPPGAEGCTPGFRKNHPEAWVGFSPNQTLESVFDVPDALGFDDVTLLAALSFQGGSDTQGAAEILLRAAVTALLNAASPGADYPDTVAEIVAFVNAALASGDRDTILALASELDTLNNLGCPL